MARIPPKIRPCWTAFQLSGLKIRISARCAHIAILSIQNQRKAWHSQSILCGSDKVSNKQRGYLLGCCEFYVKSTAVTAITIICPTSCELWCSAACFPIISDLFGNLVQSNLLLFHKGLLGGSQNCTQKHSDPACAEHCECWKKIKRLGRDCTAGSMQCSEKFAEFLKMSLMSICPKAPQSRSEQS